MVSGPGLILYAFTISFAAIDWVMSLDPSWISTIYGLIFLAGELISALCFAIVIERILFNYKPMSRCSSPTTSMIMAISCSTFIMVWAYFSFSQWLIIWAGNLPAKSPGTIRRLHGGWGYVGLFLVIFPLLRALFHAALASLQARHSQPGLARVWMLVARYVDLYWHIEPSFSQRLQRHAR